MPESWEVKQLSQVADVISTRMAYAELENTFTIRAGRFCKGSRH